MLQTMHISNIALIDDIEVTFEEGLNILSGETGAGKSIIIGSIALAFGGKFTKDLLKDPEKPGLIELIFHLEENTKKELANILEEHDFTLENGDLIISRKLMGNKTVSRINGETVTQKDLSAITGYLLDLHGQHEHQSLLKKSKHLELLDEYAKAEVCEVKEELLHVYREYREIENELSKMTMNEEMRERELAFCSFEINEIDSAALTEGEEEQLVADYKKTSHAKQIVNGLAKIHEALDGSRSSASLSVTQAIKTIGQIISCDEGLCDIQKELYDLESVLNDLCRDVKSYMDSVDVDEERLATLQQRIDLIHNLKRKYGNSIEAVLKHREESYQKMLSLKHYELHRKDLCQQKEKLEKRLENLSDTLHEKRQKAARILEKELEKSLKELNFLRVIFQIAIEPLPSYTSNGKDDVCFYISTNPGSEPRPLQQVASGGELSRIMLAIKAIMARSCDVDTLVFDEIDTGISGRTAQKVAQLLRKIGRTRQVICISHLPQIVSMANTHFLIEKTTDAITTQTLIYRLNEEESVREIARLLGGRDINELVLENARQMKRSADTEDA